MKKTKTRLLSIILCGIMLMSVAAIPAKAARISFPDVPEDAWFYDAVTEAAESGYMIGTGTGTGAFHFSPNAPMSRGMFVQVLANFTENYAPEDYKRKDPVFSDVPVSIWYAGAVHWAVENGIVSGTSATAFSPELYVTRQEMAVMLYHYAIATENNFHADDTRYFTFNDLSEAADWAVPGLRWATTQNVLNGTTQKKLTPTAVSTRAEVAAMIVNAQTALTKRRIEAKPVSAEDKEIYTHLEGMKFHFASGAGGWSTDLTMGADGRFTGGFHDSDMGGGGPENPNGFRYECNFQAALELIGRVDKYSYLFRLKDLKIKEEQERIENGVKIIPVKRPYGLDYAREMMLYLPGMQSKDLPADFVQWTSHDETGILDFHGLYNIRGQQGFYSDELYAHDD